MYDWWFLVNLMGRATITAIQFGGISIIPWRFLGVHILESHPRLRIGVGSVPCEWFCFVAPDSYFGNNVRNRWRGLDSVHASRPPRPPPHEVPSERRPGIAYCRASSVSLWLVQSPLRARSCFSPPCRFVCCSSYLDSLPAPPVACSFPRELKYLFCFLYDSSCHSVASPGNGQALCVRLAIALCAREPWLVKRRGSGRGDLVLRTFFFPTVEHRTRTYQSGSWWWSHNFLNLLKSIELQKWVILWYVSYTSLKLVKISTGESDAHLVLTHSFYINIWMHILEYCRKQVCFSLYRSLTAPEHLGIFSLSKPCQECLSQLCTVHPTF